MSKLKTNKNMRFVGKNGEFVPTNQPKEGFINVEYLLELCEWTYYHDNMEYDEKLKNLLGLEKYIQELLNTMVGFPIKNQDIWSTKLVKNK